MTQPLPFVLDLSALCNLLRFLGSGLIAHPFCNLLALSAVPVLALLCSSFKRLNAGNLAGFYFLEYS